MSYLALSNIIKIIKDLSEIQIHDVYSIHFSYHSKNTVQKEGQFDMSYSWYICNVSEYSCPMNKGFIVHIHLYTDYFL